MRHHSDILKSFPLGPTYFSVEMAPTGPKATVRLDILIALLLGPTRQPGSPLSREIPKQPAVPSHWLKLKLHFATRLSHTQDLYFLQASNYISSASCIDFPVPVLPR